MSKIGKKTRYSFGNIIYRSGNIPRQNDLIGMPDISSAALPSSIQIADPIRRFLCDVDNGNKTFKLKSDVKIVSNKENYTPQLGSYGGYDGEIIIEATPDIINKIMSLAYPSFEVGRNTQQIGSRTTVVGSNNVQTNTLNPAFNVFIPDNYFNFYKHYEYKKETEQLNLQNTNVLKYKIDFEYNFLIEKYEDYLNKPDNIGLSELNLPYFYEVMEFKNGLQSVPELNEYDGVEGSAAFYKNYEAITFFNKPEGLINPNGVRNEVKHLILNSYIGIENKKLIPFNKYLAKFNPFKSLFPFYVNILLDTHTKAKNSISNLFHQYNVYGKLLKDFKLNKQPAAIINIDKGAEQIENYNLSKQFLRNVFNDQLKDPSFVFMLNSRLHNLHRKFEKVLDFGESHTEVIGYNIQKFYSNNPNLIQEWYIPNISDEPIEFIDSQIKYSKNFNFSYQYKLNSIILFVGNEYKYKRFEPIGNNQLKILYENYPTYNIIQVSDTSLQSGMLSDDPPMPPDITFIPYTNNDRKINILLNTGIGSYYSDPIILKPTEDSERFSYIARAQELKPNETKLFFEADEPSKHFEIYRINFKPTSYADFIGNLYTTIDTNGNTSANFIDDILPNTKYYYIARSVDYHNYPSNPTKVFEIEIVNQDNLVYPLINLVEFEENKNLIENIKTFRRYIKISPAFGQKILSAENATKDSVKLGVLKDAVWNKNIKMRLTSKQSGKKIDINFKFIYDTIKK